MMAMMLEQGETSDSVLIGRAQQGDRAAFGELVERHYDFVFRVAYRWCGVKADAEDIAQDVCVRIGRALGSYRGAGAFTTWLYALTLNAARDGRRRVAREMAKTQAFAAEALADGEAGPNSAEDPTQALWAAVRQLPDKQREAVLLVYGEGLSHAEAADAMGLSDNTVAWHIHEAKKRLRAMMLPAGED